MNLDKLSFREIECLHMALRLMQSQLDRAMENDIEVPESHIKTVQSLTEMVAEIHSVKYAEVNKFFEIIEDLDELQIASEIIENNPEIVIPEYK